MLHATEGKPAELLLTTGAAGPSPSTRSIHTGGLYIAPWIQQVPAVLAMSWDDTFGLRDFKGNLKLAKPVTTKLAPAIAAASTGVDFGVVYARASDYKLEFLPLNAVGTPIGSARVVGEAAISAAPIRHLSLAWTGSQYVLAYLGKGGFRAQLINANGTTAGAAVKLPSCMSWSHGLVDLAWRGDRGAAVYEGGCRGRRTRRSAWP